MTTETNNELVEYEYEVWQDGVLQAGGREADYDSAQSEANHYAKMYVPEGPVEVRIYEKRLISNVQQQPSEEAERDWLAEALDALADRRFDALFGGLSDADREAALRAEIKKLRREVEEWRDYAEAQMELRDEAEARANKLDKILRAYQAAVNKIDDLIEYSLPMPSNTKAALYAVLTDLTDTLAKELTND